MRADVAQRAGTHRAAVAPCDRHLRVGPVVAPIASVEVQDLAERPAVGQLRDLGDRRVATVTEADARDHGRVGGLGSHGGGVVEVVTQRLLAQHVLTGRHQGQGDLAVQLVGHHDRDDVDVVGLDDLMPVGGGALVAVAVGGIGGEGQIGVADGRQSHLRHAAGAEDGAHLTPGVGVRAPRHTGADHGY